MHPLYRARRTTGPAAYSPAAGGGGGLSIVGQMIVAPASTATTDISFASLSPLAGDLCLVAYADSASSATVTAKGTGIAFSSVLLGAQSSFRWDEASANASSNRVKVFRRALSSTDASNGNVTIASHQSSSGGLLVLIRGGATTAVGNALPNYQASTATTAPGVTGFTPGGSTLGALIFAMIRTITLDVTSATGWTIEADGLTGWANGTMSLLSNLSGYAGGTVTVNQGASGSNPEIAFMLELQ